MDQQTVDEVGVDARVHCKAKQVDAVIDLGSFPCRAFAGGAGYRHFCSEHLGGAEDQVQRQARTQATRYLLKKKPGGGRPWGRQAQSARCSECGAAEPVAKPIRQPSCGSRISCISATRFLRPDDQISSSSIPHEELRGECSRDQGGNLGMSRNCRWRITQEVATLRALPQPLNSSIFSARGNYAMRQKKFALLGLADPTDAPVIFALHYPWIDVKES